jgi:prepilin-type N-terminal cleavage/methylation domain-containing protein
VNRPQRGFTLVELVAVLLIIGALSVVAVAKFNPATFEARAAADELLAAIRYAQEKSMSNTGATDYQIAVTSSGYAVTQGGAAIPHPVTGAAGYSRTWSDVSLSPATTIVFDGYGAPNLAAPVTITLSHGSESASVTVENVTGFAR